MSHTENNCDCLSNFDFNTQSYMNEFKYNCPATDCSTIRRKNQNNITYKYIRNLESQELTLLSQDSPDLVLSLHGFSIQSNDKKKIEDDLSCWSRNFLDRITDNSTNQRLVQVNLARKLGQWHFVIFFHELNVENLDK